MTSLWIQHSLTQLWEPGRDTFAVTEVPEIDAREYRLFQSLDADGDGVITVEAIWEALLAAGLHQSDIRLADARERLSAYAATDVISFAEFTEAIRPNILLIERALQGKTSPFPTSRSSAQRSSRSTTKLVRIETVKSPGTSPSWRESIRNTLALASVRSTASDLRSATPQRSFAFSLAASR